MHMKTFSEKYPNFIEPYIFSVIRISKRTWRYRNYEHEPGIPDFNHLIIMTDYANIILNIPNDKNLYSNILNRNYCEHI